MKEFIPKVKIPSSWKSLKSVELRRVIFEYIKKNFSGLEVINDDIKIKVTVSTRGLRKSSFGEAMYSKKAVVLYVLPDLIKYAKYNNFGKRKEQDNKDVLGYLNFKSKCEIDGKVEHLRLSVRFQKGGKFYYNIEVNKKETVI